MPESNNPTLAGREAPTVEGPNELPRALMQSHLAQAQEATFNGFDASVQKDIFSGPHRRLFEVVYRMGFESGWRIREGFRRSSVRVTQGPPL